MSRTELEEQCRALLVRSLPGGRSSDATEVSGIGWTAGPGVAAGYIRIASAAGILVGRSSDVCSVTETPALRVDSRIAGQEPGQAAGHNLGSDRVVGQVGPDHDGGLSDRKRGTDLAPATGTAGAFHAGGEALGRHPGAADHRHPGQRAHPGGDGKPAADRCRDQFQVRDHRHHRRAHGGYAGGAASAEDDHSCSAHGRRVHHQRSAAADCADHRAPGHQPGRRDHEGQAVGCIRAGAGAERADGGAPGVGDQ